MNLVAGRETDKFIEECIFGKKFHRTFTPDYSTVVESAWLVANEIGVFDRYLLGRSGEVWQLSTLIPHEGLYCVEEAETFPMLICQFALRGRLDAHANA